MNIPNPFHKDERTEDERRREQEIKQSIQEAKEEEAMQKRAELNRIHEEELHNKRRENEVYTAQQQASKERQYGRGTTGKVNEFASKGRQGISSIGNSFLRLQEASSHGVTPKAPRTYAKKQRYARTVTMQPPAQPQDSNPYGHLFDIGNNPMNNKQPTRSTSRDFGALTDTKSVFMNTRTSSKGARDYNSMFSLKKGKRRW